MLHRGSSEGLPHWHAWVLLRRTIANVYGDLPSLLSQHGPQQGRRPCRPGDSIPCLCCCWHDARACDQETEVQREQEQPWKDAQNPSLCTYVLRVVLVITASSVLRVV